MTVPLIVLLGLLLGGAGSKDPGSAHPSSGAALAPVTVPAPADTGATTVSTCAQVISELPLTLNGQNLRQTVSKPASPSIVAWGNPAIVLRCGVSRPAALTSTLQDEYLAANRVLFLPVREGKTTVFTVIDRAVYIDVTVPTSYAQPPLGLIADAIRKALPNPVCGDGTTPDTSKLCTRRK